jgi:putative hemolysin
LRKSPARSTTRPIHDLPDIGVHLDTVEPAAYTAAAGLLLTRLGHIPTGTGETVDLGRYTAEVAGISGRAITRIRLRLKPEA